MLIIGRYSGQSFMIGDNIKVTVMGNRGKQICLGIEAPKTINIVREELIKPKKNLQS